MRMNQYSFIKVLENFSRFLRDRALFWRFLPYHPLYTGQKTSQGVLKTKKKAGFRPA